ncbi:MAG: hypothetical protein IT302_07180 [Dehalococcoidia bacterium]|nr:hypothetical protein [Dehalococcoidia bacterium]
MLKLLPVFAVTAVLSLALAACGDGNGTDATPTLAPLPTASLSPTAPPPTVTPTVAASPTPAGTPTPLPDDVVAVRQQVIAAATAELKGRYVTPLNRDACLANNPQQLLCFDITSRPDTLVRGIAQLATGDPQGGGATVFFGRQANGEWHYWFGTQQAVSPLVTLPGEAFACGGGQGITIRSQASDTSEAVAKVAELAQLRVQQFVLTAAGSTAPGAPRGDGWYRVNIPATGWVNARDITDSANKNCSLHDAIYGSGPRG